MYRHILPGTSLWPWDCEVPESVDSYLKSEDATDYLEVIQAEDLGFIV